MLRVNIPRGPRHTDWGVQLLSPSGQILDERPVVRRVESIHMALHANGAAAPTSSFVIGDRSEPPTPSERDQAVRAARSLDEAARRAAADRRFSDAGQLTEYLRLRFSFREGELLVLDPFLFGRNDMTIGQSDEVIRFLALMNRPVRAMTGKIGPTVRERLGPSSQIAVRELPDGTDSLHDRVWIVGETALHVGASLNGILAPNPTSRRLSTVAEMSHSDALAWRQRFAAWWEHSTATSCARQPV